MLEHVKKGMPYIGLVFLLGLITFSAYSSEDNRRNEQNLKQDPLEMAHCVCQRCQVDGMKARFAKNARQHKKLDIDMAAVLRKLNSTCLFTCTNKNCSEEASHAKIKNKMELLAVAYDDVAYEYSSILKNLPHVLNNNPPTGLDENLKAAQQNALWLKTEVLCSCSDNQATR